MGQNVQFGDGQNVLMDTKKPEQRKNNKWINKQKTQQQFSKINITMSKIWSVNNCKERWKSWIILAAFCNLLKLVQATPINPPQILVNKMSNVSNTTHFLS